jgi:hypothetical protein
MLTAASTMKAWPSNTRTSAAYHSWWVVNGLLLCKFHDYTSNTNSWQILDPVLSVKAVHNSEEDGIVKHDGTMDTSNVMQTCHRTDKVWMSATWRLPVLLSETDPRA